MARNHQSKFFEPADIDSRARPSPEALALREANPEIDRRAVEIETATESAAAQSDAAADTVQATHQRRLEVKGQHDQARNNAAGYEGHRDHQRLVADAELRFGEADRAMRAAKEKMKTAAEFSKAMKQINANVRAYLGRLAVSFDAPGEVTLPTAKVDFKSDPIAAFKQIADERRALERAPMSLESAMVAIEKQVDDLAAEARIRIGAAATARPPHIGWPLAVVSGGGDGVMKAAPDARVWMCLMHRDVILAQAREQLTEAYGDVTTTVDGERDRQTKLAALAERKLAVDCALSAQIWNRFDGGDSAALRHLVDCDPRSVLGIDTPLHPVRQVPSSPKGGRLQVRH